jgi:acyl-coenzyme A thioesterase PaaI-like protein
MTNKRFYTDRCFCCGRNNLKGLNLKIEKDGLCSLINCKVPEEYQSYPGIVHGGIITTLLDEALWYAFFFNGIYTFTRKLNVTFKKSIPIDYPVIVRGEVVKKLKSSLWSGKATITDEDGLVYAFAIGEFFESRNLKDKLFIYSDET